jgi:hypothetical protein
MFDLSIGFWSRGEEKRAHVRIGISFFRFAESGEERGGHERYAVPVSEKGRREDIVDVTTDFENVGEC